MFALICFLERARIAWVNDLTQTSFLKWLFSSLSQYRGDEDDAFFLFPHIAAHLALCTSAPSRQVVIRTRTHNGSRSHPQTHLDECARATTSTSISLFSRGPCHEAYDLR